MVNKITFFALFLVPAFTCQSDTAIINDLYKAAHEKDVQTMQRIVRWCKEQRKENAVSHIEQAIGVAIEQHHDAPATELLTIELAHARMGNWERYYRGITLLATGIAIAATLLFED